MVKLSLIVTSLGTIRFAIARQKSKNKIKSNTNVISRTILGFVGFCFKNDVYTDDKWCFTSKCVEYSQNMHRKDIARNSHALVANLDSKSRNVVLTRLPAKIVIC